MGASSLLPALLHRRKAVPALSPSQHFVLAVKSGSFGGAVRYALPAYTSWWTALLQESPEHVAVETTLIIFLIFVLVAGRRARRKAVEASKQQVLTEAEVDELVDEWEPQPLGLPLPVSLLRTTRDAPSSSSTMGDKKKKKKNGLLSKEKDSSSAKKMMMANDAREKALIVAELSRRAKVITSWDGPYVAVNHGKKALNFGSFDFLGLSQEKKTPSTIKQAAEVALRKYGCGSCGPRGFYGSIDVHEALEKRAALFAGVERAIAFSDASSCATSTIAAFAKRGDLLVVDDSISEPLRTGCVLSRATVATYRHNDVEDLERVLRNVAADDVMKHRRQGSQRRFVVCESASRDTCDLAPLPQIVKLKTQFGYRLILDEGTTYFAVGPTGRGACELLGINAKTEVDVLLVDLGPALGSVGGLCLGSEEIIEHQRLSGAGYCFSAAAPPFVSAAALAALDVLESPDGLERLDKLRMNAARLRKNLRDLGVDDLLHAPSLIDRNHHSKHSEYDASQVFAVLDAPAFDTIPFVSLAAASSSTLDDLVFLDEIADKIYDAGFAVSVVKHGLLDSGKKSAAAPSPSPSSRGGLLGSQQQQHLRPKQLALRLAVGAHHSTAQIDAVCAALHRAVHAQIRALSSAGCVPPVIGGGGGGQDTLRGDHAILSSSSSSLSATD